MFLGGGIRGSCHLRRQWVLCRWVSGKQMAHNAVDRKRVKPKSVVRIAVQVCDITPKYLLSEAAIRDRPGRFLAAATHRQTPANHLGGNAVAQPTSIVPVRRARCASTRSRGQAPWVKHLNPSRPRRARPGLPAPRRAMRQWSAGLHPSDNTRGIDQNGRMSLGRRTGTGHPRTHPQLLRRDLRSGQLSNAEPGQLVAEPSTGRVSLRRVLPGER